jgi:hypothetical protein
VAATQGASDTWTAIDVVVGVLALISGVVVGVRLLGRPRKGPEDTVSWRLRPTGKFEYVLENAGTLPAYDVEVEITPGGPTTGETKFSTFAPHQTETYVIAEGFGSKYRATPRVFVRWSNKKGKRQPEWSSGLPG